MTRPELVKRLRRLCADMVQAARAVADVLWTMFWVCGLVYLGLWVLSLIKPILEAL